MADGEAVDVLDAGLGDRVSVFLVHVGDAQSAQVQEHDYGELGFEFGCKVLEDLRDMGVCACFVEEDAEAFDGCEFGAAVAGELQIQAIWSFGVSTGQSGVGVVVERARCGAWWIRDQEIGKFDGFFGF